MSACRRQDGAFDFVRQAGEVVIQGACRVCADISEMTCVVANSLRKSPRVGTINRELTQQRAALPCVSFGQSLREGLVRAANREVDVVRPARGSAPRLAVKGSSFERPTDGRRSTRRRENFVLGEIALAVSCAFLRLRGEKGEAPTGPSPRYGEGKRLSSLWQITDGLR